MMIQAIVRDCNSSLFLLPSSFDCGGSCAGTGRRLLIAATQVRFLPPQLYLEVSTA